MWMGKGEVSPIPRDRGERFGRGVMAIAMGEGPPLPEAGEEPSTLALPPPPPPAPPIPFSEGLLLGMGMGMGRGGGRHSISRTLPPHPARGSSVFTHLTLPVDTSQNRSVDVIRNRAPRTMAAMMPPCRGGARLGIAPGEGEGVTE